MGYKFWTNKELVKLHSLSSEKYPEEIAAILGRSYGSVISKALELSVNLKKRRPKRAWSEDDLNLFKFNSISQVATLTGRTYGAVIQKNMQLRKCSRGVKDDNKKM